jgi:hypothetical protein
MVRQQDPSSASSTGSSLMPHPHVGPFGRWHAPRERVSILRGHRERIGLGWYIYPPLSFSSGGMAPRSPGPMGAYRVRPPYAVLSILDSEV